MNKYYIFTINNPLGGAGKRLIEFLNYLEKKNEKSYLLCYDSELLDEVRDYQNLKIYTIPSPIQNVIFHAGFSLLFLFLILFKERGKYIVGLSFVGNSGISLALVKKFIPNQINLNTFLRGAELHRTVIRSSRTYSFDILRKLHVKIHKYLMQFLLSKTDKLITQSETGYKTLEHEYSQLNPDRSFVLPNNCNSEWIQKSARNSELHEISIPLEVENSFKLCWIGRATMYVKGLDIMVRVVENLKELNIHTFIVGDGNDLAKVKKMISQKNLGEKVTFFGYLSNPITVLAHSDLLVVPSRSDPYPNVIFEAMAIGKPVLGSKIDGIPEILKYEELLFPPDDEGFLESKIKQAYNDPAYYSIIKSLLQSRVKYFTFNWSEKLKQIIDE